MCRKWQRLVDITLYLHRVLSEYEYYQKAEHIQFNQASEKHTHFEFSFNLLVTHLWPSLAVMNFCLYITSYFDGYATSLYLRFPELVFLCFQRLLSSEFFHLTNTSPVTTTFVTYLSTLESNSSKSPPSFKATADEVLSIL